MTSVRLFQIYYNEATKAALDPGFTPLNNMRNERPDWYEFWVIRQFFRNNQPTNDDWYGFFSPKFGAKTGLSARQIISFLDHIKDDAEVALISTAWDQIAYFQNPFEQGEFWHPGIATLSQSLFQRIGFNIDVECLVTYSGNFTFCNYIVAKLSYWHRWLSLADAVYDFIEHPASSLAGALQAPTSYTSATNLVPMKAFIQERLPSLILTEGRYRIATLDASHMVPILDALFHVEPNTRGILQTCDVLKARFCHTRNVKFLDLYREIRALISLKGGPISRQRAQI